ncbi:hypothetical protein HHI36_013355 [Cryptolaemus montrouzieri]|uniref:Uncharacterized protein n=1 Tax=Cryptolaemus montrouzieri TaxID=559131 RepID=A0ABD2NHM8_9CUCU
MLTLKRSNNCEELLATLESFGLGPIFNEPSRITNNSRKVAINRRPVRKFDARINNGILALKKAVEEAQTIHYVKETAQSRAINLEATSTNDRKTSTLSTYKKMKLESYGIS